MQKKLHKKEKQNGFTLLFAVLLSVLVLAVGASVINIAMKQVILTGIGRESQFAFYAANTGIECALYWDYRDARVFATSSLSDGYTEEIDKEGVRCAKDSIYMQDNGTIGEITDNSNNSESSAISRFTIRFEDSIQYCAIVSVTKNKNTDDTWSTTIESRGYNTCDKSNPRRIERGLQLFY